ncbi:hypothetical protein H0H81_009093 [Sphagnurus paluster]|uniref:Protein kinase domain-containing protein n=1 Tax=Sphagnurus paluster TaxID=117069 RepID=A0A9P7GL65_9AGAR|nr:hypothetical protein H0H81_009093 [Sphagnurus paluster]
MEDKKFDVDRELALLLDYNPPSRHSPADVCSALESPLCFYEKHLDAGLALKKIQNLPMATYLSETVDYTLQSLEDKKSTLPARYMGDRFITSEYREPDTSMADANTIAHAYLSKTARFAEVIASTLLLHVGAPGWYSSLLWTRREHEGNQKAFCEDYGLEIRELMNDSVGQNVMDDGKRDVLRRAREKYPRMALWNFFPISPISEKMLQDMSSLSSAQSFDHETCRTIGYLPPPATAASTLDALLTAWGPPVTSLVADSAKEREVLASGKDEPTRITRSRKRVKNQASHKQSIRENDLNWPTVRITALSREAPDLTRSFIKRAWARSVEYDTTYLIFNCGNHERIGFRHRASQTLFLSDLIEIPSCKAPSYGKIHIGLFIAITQDAIDRSEQHFKAQENHETKKRRRSVVALPLDKRPRTRAAAKKKISEEEEYRKNLEAVKEESRSRPLALVELRYSIYNSPAPASFLRLGHLQKTSYGPEEYLSVIVASKIAAGATGVAHEAQLRLLTSGGNFRSTNAVIKLAFEPEQNERLRHEFGVYEHLFSRGVAEGMPTVYGLFKDAESDTLALLMSHVGASLWSLNPYQRRFAFTLRISEEVKSAYLRALGAIHQAGVRHRDIRPENLTLMEGDRVAIIDFDMAELNPSEGAKRREMCHMKNLLNGSYRPPNEYPSDATTPEKKPVETAPPNDDFWGLDDSD